VPGYTEEDASRALNLITLGKEGRKPLISRR
jgi:hypothetical protein